MKLPTQLPRRSFLGAITGGVAATLTRPMWAGVAAARKRDLEAGEGVVDTTPPLGIEMAGFHRPLGDERRIAGIRQPSAARALILRLGEVQVVFVSLDICGVSAAMTARVQQRIAKQLRIPAAHIHLSATHTHSMPTFRFLRQWGAISPEYMAAVETKIVQAVHMAQADLAPAELSLGKSRAPGASNNRTTKTWYTEQQFTKDSSDAQRWLDTMVHVLHFERAGEKRDLLWYHFSAHPVCYQDDQAGPDWPGLVADLVHQKHKLTPSFLQGHSGDVNAGDAEHWIGAAENTAGPVAAAIARSLDSAKPVRVDCLRMRSQQTPLPLDQQRFARWIAAYRRAPAECNTGPWVDARFAKAWLEDAVRWDVKVTQTMVPLSAMQLGELAVVLHPAELYSSYGLTIQRDSPLPNTLVVGYTDDLIGYLPDPTAYQTGEYSAITVPKIIGLPPFAPTAGRRLTKSAVTMLKEVVG